MGSKVIQHKVDQNNFSLLLHCTFLPFFGQCSEGNYKTWKFIVTSLLFSHQFICFFIFKWHAFTTWVSEFSLEGQNLISPNLHTIRNMLFVNYIFHFPLMKVEGSAETLGLLETLNIIYTILTRVTFFYFLICFFIVLHYAEVLADPAVTSKLADTKVKGDFLWILLTTCSPASIFSLCQAYIQIHWICLNSV